MDKRVEECLLAMESIAGDIFGRAESCMIDIGETLQAGNAEMFWRNESIEDIANDFSYIIGLAERGLKVVKELELLRPSGSLSADGQFEGD